MIRYLQDCVLDFLQRRCQHPGEMVAVDILEGCSKDYEERHPLDMIQPRPDLQRVVDARYSAPVFVTDNQVQPEDL